MSSKFIVPRESIVHQLNVLIETIDASVSSLQEGFYTGDVDLETFVRDYARDKARFYSLTLKLRRVSS
jgi:hypothetical protein